MASPLLLLLDPIERAGGQTRSLSPTSLPRSCTHQCLFFSYQFEAWNGAKPSKTLYLQGIAGRQPFGRGGVAKEVQQGGAGGGESRGISFFSVFEFNQSSLAAANLRRFGLEPDFCLQPSNVWGTPAGEREKDGKYIKRTPTCVPQNAGAPVLCLSGGARARSSVLASCIIDDTGVPVSTSTVARRGGGGWRAKWREGESQGEGIHGFGGMLDA